MHRLLTLIWIAGRTPASTEQKIFFNDVFLQQNWSGVVSQKLQLGHGLRALCHGNIAIIAKPKKYSNATPKLGKGRDESEPRPMTDSALQLVTVPKNSLDIQFAEKEDGAENYGFGTRRVGSQTAKDCFGIGDKPLGTVCLENDWFAGIVFRCWSSNTVKLCDWRGSMADPISTLRGLWLRGDQNSELCVLCGFTFLICSISIGIL